MSIGTWARGRRLAMVPILAVLTLLTACGPVQEPEIVKETVAVTPGPEPPRPGGTLVVGLATNSIATLDPAAYSDRTTETVVRNIFDGLVTRTINNQIVL